MCVSIFLISGDTVVPRKAKTHGMKIFYRFHFSSALKRMSVIAGHTPQGSVDVNYIAAVKGAPETIRSMVGILCFIALSVCCRFVIFLGQL